MLALGEKRSLAGCFDWCGRLAGRAGVGGKERVGGARGESVAAACGANERGEVVAVGWSGEVVGCEAGLVAGEEVGVVLANEAQECRTRARLQKERIGGEEASASLGGAGGHGVERFGGVGDSG